MSSKLFWSHRNLSRNASKNQSSAHVLWKHIGIDAEITIPERAPERENLKSAGPRKPVQNKR
jgi:hypothetical protein